jgi:hypothetical protein
MNKHDVMWADVTRKEQDVVDKLLPISVYGQNIPDLLNFP